MPFMAMWKCLNLGLENKSWYGRHFIFYLCNPILFSNFVFRKQTHTPVSIGVVSENLSISYEEIVMLAKQDAYSQESA